MKWWKPIIIQLILLTLLCLVSASRHDYDKFRGRNRLLRCLTSMKINRDSKCLSTMYSKSARKKARIIQRPAENVRYPRKANFLMGDLHDFGDETAFDFQKVKSTRKNVEDFIRENEIPDEPTKEHVEEISEIESGQQQNENDSFEYKYGQYLSLKERLKTVREQLRNKFKSTRRSDQEKYDINDDVTEMPAKQKLIGLQNFQPKRNFDLSLSKKTRKPASGLFPGQVFNSDRGDMMTPYKKWKRNKQQTNNFHYGSRKKNVEMTTTVATTESPTNHRQLFLGGQRRGIVVKEDEEDETNDAINEIPNAGDKSLMSKNQESRDKFDDKAKKEALTANDPSKTLSVFFTHHGHELRGPLGYDRELCADLRVPCRFVNDHPCCKFEMPLDLVARARSMDGSADLKWRSRGLGGPRTGPQGRSFLRSKYSRALDVTSKPSLVDKSIRYNYAKKKQNVSIPKYYYNGGPELTSTIVGLCWRLHYLRCPQNLPDFTGKWVEMKKLKQIHPCCQMLSKPSAARSPASTRLTRWLNA